MANRHLTYRTFRNEILRKLGANFQPQSITDKQVDMMINEAYTYFTMYHYDGSNKDMVIYVLGDDDIKGKTLKMRLPSNVTGVSEVYPLGAISGLTLASPLGGTATPLANIFSGIFGFNLMGGTSACFGLSNMANGAMPLWDLINQNMEMWRRRISPTPLFNYQSSENVLTVYGNGVKGTAYMLEVTYSVGLGLFNGGGEGSIMAGQKLGDDDTPIHFLEKNNYLGDLELAYGFLNDPLLSEYAYYLCVRQIARNMRVSGSIPHLGGVKFNPDAFRLETDESIEKIEAKIRSMAMHPAFMIGG